MMTERPGSIGEVRERREDLRRRMIELEDATARPAGGDPEVWWKSIHDHLDALRDAWDHHVVTTERPDGFLDEVVAHAPQLARRRDMLVKDHVEISGLFDDVMARQVPSPGAEVEGVVWVDAARDDLVGLLGALVRHRHRGAEFTYDAYNVDLAEAAD
jgi:hypothetical protein